MKQRTKVKMKITPQYLTVYSILFIAILIGACGTKNDLSFILILGGVVGLIVAVCYHIYRSTDSEGERPTVVAPPPPKTEPPLGPPAPQPGPEPVPPEQIAEGDKWYSALDDITKGRLDNLKDALTKRGIQLVNYTIKQDIGFYLEWDARHWFDSLSPEARLYITNDDRFQDNDSYNPNRRMIPIRKIRDILEKEDVDRKLKLETYPAECETYHDMVHIEAKGDAKAKLFEADVQLYAKLMLDFPEEDKLHLDNIDIQNKILDHVIGDRLTDKYKKVMAMKIAG